MAREVLQNYRSTFIGVKCIIIDEVSLIGCDVLHKINLRLQEITGVHDQPFGNLNIIFCRNLHQLPPVNASPVYKGHRNSICGPVLWQSLDYYPLEQKFRLFHRNHDVDAYNNSAFIPEFENIADDKMIGYNTLTEVVTARRNLHKMSVVESGGLPYSLKLAVGYPYMITMNLDVEDGLVNGAIGTLKYIEYLTEDEQVTIYGTTEVDVEPQPSTSTRIRKTVRLWLEFPNPSMDQLCRVKAKPHVMCKRDVLDLKWTPIVTRAANIPLGGNIKCRRNQFPVVSASAITIHKSQGGTFDEVVFIYDKSQQIQLVYVALSRVTSIDGLYLTNDKDDFKFYHGRGSTAPTVKDIRDEYDRMVNHCIPTLSMEARAFCKRDVLAERNEDQGGYLHRRRQLILIVSAFNAQSLVAHAGDIESNNILINSDYMGISETWMNCANTVMINGFELRASNNTALEHRTHCPSTSSELPVRVSAAGGSAIYRNLQSSTNCSEIIVNANKSCGNSVLRKHNVGDICLVDVKIEDLTLFILGAVYIHPKASVEKLLSYIFINHSCHIQQT
ncbi:ATP-dependent DNA helicase [Trichonephila clavipes]|nr:ATP-dependent DNA helicase [Trichonephila clavipes]